MEDLLKTHLVFADKHKELIEAVLKYCIITGWSSSIEEAGLWAKNGGGEDPDLFFINGSLVCADSSKKSKANARKIFIDGLTKIQKTRNKSRLILLLPEDMQSDYDLITKLLKLRIYDFWFLDRFDEDDIREFLLTKRSALDVEEYIKELEEERERNLKNTMKRTESGIKLEQLYKPYYVKSNVLAFWSEDHSLINHALALLTSITLADHGFKVALVEAPAAQPLLASTCSIHHPYYSTSHAISMFAAPNNQFIKNCFFNKRQYLEDPHTPDREIDLSQYPDNLFFLPDGKREDNVPEEQIKKIWRDFITELTRIIIFEKDFNFLVVSCFGKNEISDVIMNDLAYLKFITVNMLPGSIISGLNHHKGTGRAYFIGTNYIRYLANELKDLQEAPFLYPPGCFEEDFLDFIYLKKHWKVGQETQSFINHLVDLAGVKITPHKVEKGFLRKLKLPWR